MGCLIITFPIGAVISLFTIVPFFLMMINAYTKIPKLSKSETKEERDNFALFFNDRTHQQFKKNIERFKKLF